MNRAKYGLLIARLSARDERTTIGEGEVRWPNHQLGAEAVAAALAAQIESGELAPRGVAPPVGAGG
jgi:hypothetical protein